MMVCVVDGRGGGLGSRVVEGLREMATEGHAVIGLGLNRVSAQAMKRAGATSIESAPQMIHRRLDGADLIVGSLSLLMPGAMLGRSDARSCASGAGVPSEKVLLPINRRKVEVVGTEGRTLDAL